MPKSGIERSVPAAITYTIGSEAGNVINVALQALDESGAEVSERCSFMFYLSDDANGDSILGTAVSGSFVIGTDGVLLWQGATGKGGYLVTESDGDVDLNLTHSGAKSLYFITILPNGTLDASAIIAFT